MVALKEQDQEKDKNEFVEVTSQQAISNILKTIYNSRECVTAWQLKGGSNINTVGFFYDYKGRSEHLDFKSMELKKDLGFEKGRELYLHSECRTAIFKSEIKSLKNTEVKINFPASLRVEETREGGRVRLGIKSNYILNIFLYSEDCSKVKVECQILDYSDGGVGLIVPLHFAPFLNLQQIIEIGESNIDTLSKRFFAVRSLSPLENVLTGDRFIRVGGEFTE